jgi:ATP-dependent Clp protease ATP-binding subunit ClpA
MFARLVQRFSTPGQYRSAPGYSIGATFADAQVEARRRGDRKVGTEHLLLALLHDPASATAIGCDLASARAALETLDATALAAVGMDGLPSAPPIPHRERGRLPLTPSAKAVIVDAMRERDRQRLAPRHVLAALLGRRRPDPAADLLVVLGLDAATIRARLVQAAAEVGQ